MELWSATDAEVDTFAATFGQSPEEVPRTRVELHKVGEKMYELFLEDGPFSGYPCIKLDRKHLKDLRDAIDMELGS